MGAVPGSTKGGHDSQAPPSVRQFFPWGKGNATFYLTLLAFLAIAGVLSTALSNDVTVAIVSGIASFMVGGILGFVFGIPRYAASTSERQMQEGINSAIVRYRANTNLEQISDWLTKILVGLGLTQAREIGRLFLDTSDVVSSALGDTSTVTAGALILLTLVAGFIFFYLWSRIYLPRLFRAAEQED